MPPPQRSVLRIDRSCLLESELVLHAVSHTMRSRSHVRVRRVVVRAAAKGEAIVAAANTRILDGCTAANIILQEASHAQLEALGGFVA